MKKLGGLGKLSQFSGIKSTEPTELKEEEKNLIDSESVNEKIPVIDETVDTQISNEHLVINNSLKEKQPTKQTVTKKPKQSIKDKPVTINIKITKSQKDWLSDTASMVRDNNSEPVPPSERVYPQHLIGVAIALLQSADIDWSQIKNEKELRELLNL